MGDDNWSAGNGCAALCKKNLSEAFETIVSLGELDIINKDCVVELLKDSLDMQSLVEEMAIRLFVDELSDFPSGTCFEKCDKLPTLCNEVKAMLATGGCAERCSETDFEIGALHMLLDRAGLTQTCIEGVMTEKYQTTFPRTQLESIASKFAQTNIETPTAVINSDNNDNQEESRADAGPSAVNFVLLGGLLIISYAF